MIILGLGSNRGDRLAFLSKAVAALGGVLRGIRCSPVYESQALLPPGAPPDWDIPFFNMVVAGQGDINAPSLLAHIKGIETALGRVRRGDWSPREIDIDILAMGDSVFHSPELSIPHSQLLVRDFVLLPLADIAPHWRYPAEGPYCGMTAAAIAQDKHFVVGPAIRKTDWVVA